MENNKQVQKTQQDNQNQQDQKDQQGQSNIDNKNNATVAEQLKQAETKLQNWYNDEFLPFKQAKEQEKADFAEFAKIIVHNSNEVKHMLANIYDANYDEVIITWNTLKLEPEIKAIELVEDNLIIIDKQGEKLVINFTTLLSNIDKILGS